MKRLSPSSLADLYKSVGQIGFGVQNTIDGSEYVVTERLIDGWFIARSLKRYEKANLHPLVAAYRLLEKFNT